MNNINPATNIAYGYISAQALDDEIVQELQFGSQALEPAYERALEEAKIAAAEGGDPFDEDRFNDNYQPDEPVHEGTITVAGYLPLSSVKYRTSWLGGALNVWIFQSPVVTHKARRASPCVENAGILDTLDGSVTAYDVPPDWRREPT